MSGTLLGQALISIFRAHAHDGYKAYSHKHLPHSRVIEYTIIFKLSNFWVKMCRNSVNYGKRFLRPFAAYKCGWRGHFSLRCKMLKPPIARFPAIKLDLINRPSGETNTIYEASQVSLDTALTDFNPGKLQAWMKKMAAQVDFCLSLNAFLCITVCKTVPENWHMYVQYRS